MFGDKQIEIIKEVSRHDGKIVHISPDCMVIDVIGQILVLYSEDNKYVLYYRNYNITTTSYVELCKQLKLFILNYIYED